MHDNSYTSHLFTQPTASYDACIPCILSLSVIATRRTLYMARFIQFNASWACNGVAERRLAEPTKYSTNHLFVSIMMIIYSSSNHLFVSIIIIDSNQDEHYKKSIHTVNRQQKGALILLCKRQQARRTSLIQYSIICRANEPSFPILQCNIYFTSTISYCYWVPNTNYSAKLTTLDDYAI